MAPPRLSTAAARRIALAAQGLDRPRPGEAANLRNLDAVMRRIALVQIDSVSVVARAHLLTLFARLGPYPPGLVQRATAQPPRHLVEVWGHEACFVPPHTFNLLGWRAQRSRLRAERSPDSLVNRRPDLIEAVHEVIARGGALTAREVQAALGEPGAAQGGWWNRSDTKHALEYLFAVHLLGVAGRTASFERRYDLVERVVPDAVAPGHLDSDDAVVQLVELSARAHGVGTVRCLADYFRLPGDATAAALAHLSRAGVVEEVRVEAFGDQPAYLHAAARHPRRFHADALLAPFDSLVFERTRLSGLFGMHYRIGIYTPAAQRTHGYYALPYVLGEEVVGRVDLKTDRRAGVLRVMGWYPEPGVSATAVAGPLTVRLGEMARWLGVASVVGM